MREASNFSKVTYIQGTFNFGRRCRLKLPNHDTHLSNDTPVSATKTTMETTRKSELTVESKTERSRDPLIATSSISQQPLANLSSPQSSAGLLGLSTRTPHGIVAPDVRTRHAYEQETDVVGGRCCCCCLPSASCDKR
jgi:hypothetical protein